MSVAGILKAVFGSKSDRDMKQVKPYLNKILAAYPEIDALSDDELRAHIAAQMQAHGVKKLVFS